MQYLRADLSFASSLGSSFINWLCMRTDLNKKKTFAIFCVWLAKKSGNIISCRWYIIHNWQHIKNSQAQKKTWVKEGNIDIKKFESRKHERHKDSENMRSTPWNGQRRMSLLVIRTLHCNHPLYLSVCPSARSCVYTFYVIW